MQYLGPQFMTSLAMINTDTSSVDLFVYIVAVLGLYETTVLRPWIWIFFFSLIDIIGDYDATLMI